MSESPSSDLVNDPKPAGTGALPCADAPPEPPHPGVAARLGEKILALGERFSRPVSLLSREQAVWEGFGSVIGRVFAGAGILFLCWLLGSFYGMGSALLRRSFGLGADSGVDGAVLFILGMIAAGAAMIVFWYDWERKWRVLSWLCFTLVAVWTLMWRSNTWLQMMILAGQFAVHWLIHAALRERDRRNAWEQEMEAMQRRGTRVLNRNLLEKYRGHSGFSEEQGTD